MDGGRDGHPTDGGTAGLPADGGTAGLPADGGTLPTRAQAAMSSFPILLQNIM